MTFNKFYIKLFILIIFISVFGAFTLWSFNNNELYLSRYIICVLWIISIVFFFKHIRNVTIVIKEFISNVKEGDSMFIPSSKNAFGKEFTDLMLFLNNKIKNIKIEKEEQYHLFTNAVNQSGSGIIVFDKSGNVELINKSATKMFNLSNLKNIKDLSFANPDFPNKLDSEKETSFIVSIQVNNQLYKIAVHTNQFILRGKKLKVASFQNISNELDKEELEAWKKLMHVITHEIMNSVTPMKTLSYSLFDIYKSGEDAKKLKDLSEQDVEDTFMGLKAINNRVHGLMQFVDSYRKLYKIPEPIFENFTISDTIDEISTLFKETIIEKNINLEISGNKDLILFADKNLITQVLINLVKNAIDAINNIPEPQIQISIISNINENIITITDNGTGISKTNLNDIFIPFFTTKEKGTGIGLYYSKMIIFMHKGKIKVQSEVNIGTSFSIFL